MTLPTVAELQADLDAVRQARIDLAAGNRVEEVSRDGRRIMKGKVTLDGLTTLITILEQEIERTANLAVGRQARSAIRVTF